SDDPGHSNRSETTRRGTASGCPSPSVATGPQSHGALLSLLGADPVPARCVHTSEQSDNGYRHRYQPPSLLCCLVTVTDVATMLPVTSWAMLYPSLGFRDIHFLTTLTGWRATLLSTQPAGLLCKRQLDVATHFLGIRVHGKSNF
ncbi:hypothetical protein Cadr_000010193, partial [Camelus dromedarius]